MKDMVCLVSIIVPVYNTEKYVDTCIESLVNQTYKDIEIILVDDCSTDKSPEICKVWSRKDNRIKIISLETNSGPAVARNKGIQAAQGDYITFVDSDDWLEQECVECSFEEAKKSDADVVMWNLVNHRGKGQTLEKSLKGKERDFVDEEIGYLQGMMLTLKSETGDYALNMTGPFCKLHRTSILKKIYFPEDLNLGEDTCFVMQVFQKSRKIHYIDRDYYHRIDYNQSLSHKKDANYASRRLNYTNWMLSYCMKEKIATESEWNSFIYMNFKTVVNRYIHVFPTLNQLGAVNQIDYFINHLSQPLNWNMIDEPNEKIRRLLYNGYYWRYKVYLVYKNMMRLLT